MSLPDAPDPLAPGSVDATAPGDDPTQAPSPAPVRARRSNSPTKPGRRGHVWLILLGGLLATLLGVASYLYFAVLHHEPSAHLHVPSDSTVAMRADAAEILLFRPVREHLWPLLTQQRDDAPSATEEGRKSRLEHIADLTGVAFPDDLREVVVAAVDPTSWVVLVGGTFRRGQFVDGVEQLLREEKVGGWTREGELLVHLLGPALGQADDGTLVLATNKTIAQAALPAAESGVALPLPVDGAVSFLVNHQAWSGAVSLLPLTLPGIETLSRIGEARGSFLLSDSPRVRVTLTPKAGGDVAELQRDLERFIGAARTFILLVPGDLGGGKDALRAAVVESVHGAVEISAPWPYDALDRAAQTLADRLSGKPLPEPEPEGSWLPF